ncbi:MAG: anaerobic ribonucleoside-triphosphate reductase activating protein [Lachnospiraceae bacterium]|nr:anaerobic ribonucleoside-triphosphate reductase activating protein [Lachnospiraceae bacterium]
MQIHGLNKTTLLDYPEHVACTVFCGHCNFRCPFCQNADLVLNPSSQPCVSEDEFWNFLIKRKGMLEGVCITGGEPTLHSDLPDFIKRIKEQGLLVKLDTNGYRPDVLCKLMEENLIDYIAMDLKSSKEGYATSVGLKNFDLSAVETSVDLLLKGNIPYEFRTTVVKELHSKEDFLSIADWIKGCRAYFLQSYTESGSILQYVLPPEDRILNANTLTPYTPEELKAIISLLNEKDIPAKLRGIA